MTVVLFHGTTHDGRHSSIPHELPQSCADDDDGGRRARPNGPMRRGDWRSEHPAMSFSASCVRNIGNPSSSDSSEQLHGAERRPGCGRRAAARRRPSQVQSSAPSKIIGVPVHNSQGDPDVLCFLTVRAGPAFWTSSRSNAASSQGIGYCVPARPGRRCAGRRAACALLRPFVTSAAVRHPRSLHG